MRCDHAAGPGGEQQYRGQRKRNRCEHRDQDGAYRAVDFWSERRERTAERDENGCRQHTHVVVIPGAIRKPRVCGDRVDVDPSRCSVGGKADRAENNRHRRAPAADGGKAERMRRQRSAGKHERPRGVVLKLFEARQFHELMPRGDAPGADRGDNESADEEDQEGPGKPACPVEERNHKGRSMGRPTPSMLPQASFATRQLRGRSRGSRSNAPPRLLCGPSAGRGATTGTGFFESVRCIGACAPEAARIRSDL